MSISYDLAGMYAYLGEKEKAMAILQQFDWQWGAPNLAQWDPMFANLREDKEFKEMIQRELDEKKELREKIEKMERRGEL
jgi:hypothetical protein